MTEPAGSQRAVPTIVINALSASGGGGLTYAQNLMRTLPPDLSAEVILLGTPRQRKTIPEGRYRFVECPFASKGIVQQLVWERFALPGLLRRLGADLYYVLSGTLAARPPSGCRSVVAFRNLLPFTPEFIRRYPIGYTWLRLWTLRYTQTRSFARADLVIFVSEFGRSVIDALLPNRSGETAVIPHGVGEAFIKKPGDAPVPSRWPEGYVFYPSILDVYKAQLEVVAAWAKLRSRRDTGEKLVLAGPEWPPYGQEVRRRIDHLGLSDEVIWLGPVGHDELPGLCRNAKINVFASRLENCPNILLELLASGRPILCSTDPPMPEFGGDAVVYFDATDAEQLANLLGELIDDEARLSELGERAERRSERYRVGEAMRQTWETLVGFAG